MKYYNFHYALNLLSMLYGIDCEDEEFEEIGLLAWGLIGNKRIRLYRLTTSIDGCNSSSCIQLPCNCDEIEAVTSNFEDWAFSTNDTPNGRYSSAFTENYIESRKHFTHPKYVSGKFLPYERVGNVLYFNNYRGPVNILYRGEVLDDDGLPEITESEARAIATYIAYIKKYKEGLITNNGGLIQIAEMLQQKWNTQCDQARVDYYMTQNEWNDVLEAKTSWDRKQHSKSYKMYQ